MGSVSEAVGTSTLAGLEPNERMIKFNEPRRQVFEETSGLYNTVLGHEIGHWELHVDKILNPNSNYLALNRVTNASTRNPLALKGQRKPRPIDSWVSF